MRSLKDELRLGYTKIKELAATRGWKQVPVKAYDPVTRGTRKHFVWTQIGIVEGKPVSAASEGPLRGEDRADVIDLDVA
jgi:hypothetical protein